MSNHQSNVWYEPVTSSTITKYFDKTSYNDYRGSIHIITNNIRRTFKFDINARGLRQLRQHSGYATSSMSGFRFRPGVGNFFSTTFRLTLGPTQPPIQWAPRDLSQGVKRLGRAAGHSPPSSDEVKSVWSCTSTPSYLIFMGWYLAQDTLLWRGT
jgi:hypothetical protein